MAVSVPKDKCPECGKIGGHRYPEEDPEKPGFCFCDIVDDGVESYQPKDGEDHEDNPSFKNKKGPTLRTTIQTSCKIWHEHEYIGEFKKTIDMDIRYLDDGRKDVFNHAMEVTMDGVKNKIKHVIDLKVQDIELKTYFKLKKKFGEYY